jgi:excisionase family DNA binding protein
MWDKEVFTTGEVAKICNVTIRTVIKWFESGDLLGYKIPGSKDRRIPRDNLVDFMRRYNIPLRGLETKRRKRILIADDDENLTEILKTEFEDLGLFEIRVAHSGYQAGMVTVDFKPDVILLDYNLGDVTGVEVTQLIRENPAVARTRIIIMSGMLKGKKAKEVLEAGADEFIAKPFDFDDLKKKVLTALELV